MRSAVTRVAPKYKDHPIAYDAYRRFQHSRSAGDGTSPTRTPGVLSRHGARRQQPIPTLRLKFPFGRLIGRALGASELRASCERDQAADADDNDKEKKKQPIHAPSRCHFAAGVYSAPITVSRFVQEVRAF